MLRRTVSGPLTLLAFLSVIALLIYRRSVRDRRGLEYLYRLLASKLTREHFYLLANRVITAFLILVLSIFALALTAWLLDRHLRSEHEQENPRTTSIRFTYFTVSGHAVSDFVQGRLPKGAPPELAPGAVIVQNDVYRTLRGWTSKFGGDLATHLYPSFALPHAYAPTPFAGSRPGQIFRETSMAELQTLLKSDDKWNAIASSETDTTLFWRFARPKDIESFRKEAREWYGFYRAILPLTPPADFAIIYNYQNECEATPLLILTPRVVAVEALIIENISPRPVDIGAFTLRESTLTRFRSRDEDTQSLGIPIHRRLFPQRYLKPNERIIVPAQITFMFDDSDWFFESLKHRVMPPLPWWDKNSPRHQGAFVGVQFANEQFMTMSRNDLQRIGDRRDDLIVPHEYVAGPAVDVRVLEVDGVPMAVRPRDFKNVTIEDGFEEGSCPFLFSRASAASQWVNQGRILRGYRGKRRRGYDERTLPVFDGSILIRELEPEHSWIDEVFVEVRAPEKQRLLLFPEDLRLRRADQQSVRVDRGHDLLVRFNLHNVPQGSTFVLHVRGYYEGD